MYASEPFPHFVDDYLAYLQEVLPTQASLDGVHLHDDLLEDFSRPAIDAHVRALAGFSRRLHQIAADLLPPTERVEHRIVAADIEARMHDLEVVREWERNPQIYASAIGTSLASQALFPYAPEPERARRVVSRLRQVPRLVQAARDNIKDCPGIFVKIGLEGWRGVLRFIERDLPRAFSSLDDLHILGDLADTSSEATVAIASYVAYLETDVAPRAKASFRLGRDRFERQLKLDEGITLTSERLLAIAQRELGEVQEEFRRVAGRLNGGDPLEAWRHTRDRHPEPGTLVSAAHAQIEELQDFLRTQAIVSVPEGEPVVVAPSPEFHRWTFASMWTPGPFESKPSRAYYHLTDADRSWPAERQREHMRDFNEPALWNISIHEVFPGHFLHGRHLRQVGSKVRKSTFFAAKSFSEGWAHYCEQMVIDEGFHADDPRYRLAQVQDALLRDARFIVGLRMHTAGMTVQQAEDYFVNEGYQPRPLAISEAKRGTSDALYGYYTMGKLAILKLREDYKRKQGAAFRLQDFHDRFIGLGPLPLPLVREALLGERGTLF
jgi:uncharacterized protein (DUF885 family)